MPFPGAPPGFICNASKQHVDGECYCSACMREARPGLIEGRPVRIHPKFEVTDLVGLYDATVVGVVPEVAHLTTCCFDDATGGCQEPAEWNVWHELPGSSNPDGVVVQVCSDHLVDVLCSGKNVVWPEPKD